MKQIIDAPSIYHLLSRRQLQILRMIVEGKTDKEIANSLNISFNTVRTHHQNILNRTGQHSTGGLILFALRNDVSQLV
ncbi:response regulator transcription factor [Filimonas lacunae]|uniref:response regulator transcription factor n=1 Tax=Filimonas lacunae TaxID=477680 RepID=UPI000970D2DC|nr:LuxR C-terminal-related transcriptional regulator [Filimonas lacunae]